MIFNLVLNSFRHFFFKWKSIYFTDRFVRHDYDPVSALHKFSNGEWDGVHYINDVTVNYFNSMLKHKRPIGYTRDIVRHVTPNFYFHKLSILTWMFNQKIQTCLELGLVSHWKAKYQRNRKQKKQRYPKKLRISNILAIVRISAVFYLIAFIVFVMETFGRRNRCIKKVLDYLTY